MSGIEFFAPDGVLIIAYSLILGIILCVMYDIFRVKRIIIPAGKISLFFDDFLYCSLSSVFFVVFAYNTNNGILRWYMFASAAISFFLYNRFVSKYVLKLIYFVVMQIRKFISAIFIKPLLFIINKITNKTVPLLCKTKKFLKKIKKHFSFLRYRCKIIREISKGVFG